MYSQIWFNALNTVSRSLNVNITRATTNYVQNKDSFAFLSVRGAANNSQQTLVRAQHQMSMRENKFYEFLTMLRDITLIFLS